MDRIVVERLSYSYGARRVLEDISLRVRAGAFVGIIGPNGSGKSTILKNIYGALTPGRGKILLDGEDIRTLRRRTVAQKMAVVGQENTVPFRFTVREIVSMGRTPYKRLLEPDTPEDARAVDEAMEVLGVAELAQRDFSQLSGGEKQRVLIARAFAQQTDLLILDEPTNHLDISFQLQIFEALAASGKTVLAAIHDLNLAALFCTEIYVLDDQSILAHGPPEDMLTSERIRAVFHVVCNVSISPFTGKTSIVYRPNTIQTEGTSP